MHKTRYGWCIPTLGRQRHEIRKFKVILDLRVNLKLVWATEKGAKEMHRKVAFNILECLCIDEID